MSRNRCFVCGGFNFRADRALSGRLVCTSCGNPYGVRRTSRKRINNYNLFLIDSKKLFFIFLSIIVLLIAII